MPKMTPAERRVALIRLLAQIDQQIAECEALAADPDQTYEEKRFAAVELISCRHGRKCAERLLRGLNGEAEQSDVN